MSGYYNYSMSNNAVDAYDNWEMPISKWTKKDIINTIKKAVKNEELTLQCDITALSKLSVKTLKSICLHRSSWHHTSNHYNRTDFYSLDMKSISRITDDYIKREIAEQKQIAEQQTEQTQENKWKCSFLEWGGTHKLPVATEHIEVGVINGDWFIRQNGTKKKTTANGFRFIEKVL